MIFRNSVTWEKNETSIKEKQIDAEQNCFWFSTREFEERQLREPLTSELNENKTVEILANDSVIKDVLTIQITGTEFWSLLEVFFHTVRRSTRTEYDVGSFKKSFQ